MSVKRTHRRRAIERKRARKRGAMDRPEGNSNYARKRAFLITHGGCGSDYPDKPLKSIRLLP